MMYRVYPRKIQIETFHGCNAKCPMCSVREWRRKPGPMPSDVFGTVIDQVAEFKEHLKIVTLYMDGEPLLDKLLWDRIVQCNDAGLPNAGFSSNGALLTEEHAGHAIKSGLSWIAFSFDSIRKETYEAIRVGLNYDEVLNNILTLVQLRDRLNSRLKIVIRYIQTKQNTGQFEEVLRFWQEQLSPDLDEVDYLPETNWSRGELARGNYGKQPCYFIFNHCVVLRDGTVPLCCMDYNAEYNFGNVLESSLLDIWNSQKWQEIRHLHRQGRRSELSRCGTCDEPNISRTDLNYLA